MEKQTNFNYIKSMTREQLAKFLSETFCHGFAEQQLLEWLLQERVKNGGDHKMDIYYSSDFQCPDTGVPVMLVYDSEYDAITAEICEALEHQYRDFVNDDILMDTEKWCCKFYKHAESFEEANKIAEKYDCWF